MGKLVLNLYADTLSGKEKARKILQRFVSGEAVRDEELQMQRANGQPIWINLTVNPVRDRQGQVVGSRSIVVDITERVQAAEALRKTNRALRALSECNQVMVRTTEEAELLSEICRIIVEAGKYPMAWVGFAEQNEEKTVRPVAQAGFEEGYLNTVNITWADTERGHGPTGTAIRTGETSIAQDILTDPEFAPWRAEATKRGYAASIALPLIADGQTLGALNIYAVEPDAFDADEVRLLTELSEDLAYGIEALRSRAERKKAEETLRTSEEKYRTLIDNIQDGVFVIQEAKMQFVNDAFARMLGYTVEEVTGMDFRQLIAPEDLETVADRYRRRQAGEDVSSEYEFRMLHKDGVSRVIVNMNVGLVDYQGRVASMGTVKDITEPVQAEEALRRERDLAEALAEATAALTATLDFERVLDVILNQVSQVVPNDATNIMLIEDDQARIVRGRGYERFGTEGFVATVVYRISELPNLQQMLQSGEPMVIPDTATYPGWDQSPETKWLRSYAASPIIVHDKVIGFLNVDSATPSFFTQAHAEALRSFADHAAAAIENARLYEKVQEELTKLKQAEKALQESESRYRGIVQYQTECIIRWLPDGTVTFVNDAYCHYYGKSRDEFIGSDWLGVVAQEDREQMRAYAESLKTKLTPENPISILEHREVAADGEVHWMLWSDQAIFDEQGNLVEFR